MKFYNRIGGLLAAFPHRLIADRKLALASVFGLVEEYVDGVLQLLDGQILGRQAIKSADNNTDQCTRPG